MNYSKQSEGNWCKVCKEATHDLAEHMEAHYETP